MRIKFYLQLLLASFAVSQNATSQIFANRSLSNLNGQTSINANVLAKTNNTYNLGSATVRWKGVYLTNLGFANGSTQTTAFIPYAAGTGINITGQNIINTAPDKIVKLTAGEGISISGAYPNFTIASKGSVSQWTTSGQSVFCNSNIGIGTNAPTAKLEVVGGDAKINGLTVGTGSGANATNIAVGIQALYSNTDGYDNSAFGDHALFSNVSGSENTSLGNGALYYNVNGYGNSAVGNGALLNNGIVPNPFGNPEGNYNAAHGFFSLFNNTTGSDNAGFGTSTLFTNVSGNGNTALGSYSDVAEEDLTNATAIGYAASVNASNKIRLGNTFVSIVESSAGSWTTSDGRFKSNIKENVVGLKFIKMLRPVVYNFDAEKFDNFLTRHLPDSIKLKRKALKRAEAKSKSIIETGFIGQEVAEAAKKSGYNFNGVHVPVNDDDNYSISYEKMVVPLVKAVQELANQNEEMKKEIAELKALILAKNNTQQVNLTGAALRQNVPNPVTGNTTISYTIPSTVASAEIVISDSKGNNLKRVRLTGKENGTVEINTTGIAAGTYQYSLYVNGVVSETRQMIVSK